jgi:hypothetical protein
VGSPPLVARLLIAIIEGVASGVSDGGTT